MDVLAWSRTRAERSGVERPALDELLRRADVVSVNVALTDETRDLLSTTSGSVCMKPSAILVNTARGGIVDDEALRRRLEEGRSVAPSSTCSSGSRPGRGARAARRRSERPRHAAHRLAHRGGAGPAVRADDRQRARVPRRRPRRAPQAVARPARRRSGVLVAPCFNPVLALPASLGCSVLTGRTRPYFRTTVAGESLVA